MRLIKQIFFTKAFIALAFIASMSSCKTSTQDKNVAEIKRGRDPWVFRVNLDLRPRMLVMALHDELWVAYDMQSARLYKTWKGGINFNGPMYDGRPNIQPATKGHAYTIDTSYKNPWKLIIHGKRSDAIANYTGYSLKDGTAQLHYSIRDGNNNILITEIPEYTDQTGRPAIKRSFIVHGMPDGGELFLETYHTVRDKTKDMIVEGGKLSNLITRTNGNEFYVIADILLKTEPLSSTSLTVYYNLIELTARSSNHNNNSDSSRINDEKSIPGNWNDLLGINLCYSCDSSIVNKQADQSNKELAVFKAPGFGEHVDGVHPAFDVKNILPENFNRRISALKLLPDGRIAISTWDSTGSIYLIDTTSNKRKAAKVDLFANGLYEVMGMEYVDGRFYVLQKWELTEINDSDGDDVADHYTAVADNWSATSNYHEWAFGLLYHDGYFYFNTSIAEGQNSILTDSGIKYQPTVQTKDRGKIFRTKMGEWTLDPIAHGLRAPNGISMGLDSALFITDNSSSISSANKLISVPAEGYPYFGNKVVLEKFSQPVPSFVHPAVWIPSREISGSPSQPVYFNSGPFNENQLLIGDVHTGGLNRIFLEKINGSYQGAIFRFTQSIGAVSRFEWTLDSSLLIAGLGSIKEAGNNDLHSGLQSMKYNSKPFFDLITVRARANGFELEFSEPLRAGDGLYASDYFIQQYWYDTGKQVNAGVKRKIDELVVKSVNLTDDRKRVFVEIDGMKQQHVIHIKVKPFISDSGHQLWSGETWYTLNQIPENKGNPEITLVKKDNFLLDEEKGSGWHLLFNGTSPDNFTSSGDWKVINNELRGSNKGSALITNDGYTDFELEFDAKINIGADAGVYYRSNDKLEGTELQVIDEENNKEAQLSNKNLSAAALGEVPPKYKLSKPTGEWNNFRLLVKGNNAEHWLNGIKVVEYKARQNKKGKIGFIIQNGTVNFKNIRIRPIIKS